MPPLQNILDTTLFQYSGVLVDVRSLLYCLAVLATARFLSLLVDTVVHRRFQNTRAGFARLNSVSQIVTYFIYFTAIVFCFVILGVNITLVVASSTALLVGVGLGIQKIFGDFVSGLVILFEGIINLYDIVIYKDKVAKVKHIGIRTSTLETREGISVIVPNSQFISETLYNISHNRNPSLFTITVKVAYGSDPEKIKQILLDSAAEHTAVLDHPEPFVRLINYGDYSLDFELFFPSRSFFEIENIKSDIRIAALKKLNEENVIIPLPHMVIQKTDAVRKNVEEINSIK